MLSRSLCIFGNKPSIERVRILLGIGTSGIGTNETIEQFVKNDLTPTVFAKQYAIAFISIVLFIGDRFIEPIASRKLPRSRYAIMRSRAVYTIADAPL
jgi:hypothetical protein